MIVFDLRCSRAHVFEAWFGSSEDFAGQQDRGLVSCPMCGDGDIGKAVMAPAVGAKGNSQAVDASARRNTGKLAALQARIEAECDYVGPAFIDEARRRHEAGEPDAPVRGIFGEASISAAMDLIDEGVPIAPLPFRPRQTADA